MATDRMSGALRHLRGVLREAAGLSDGQLLEDFVSRQDEAAFAALVRRHGPMVWGVCRRVLRDHHDAEDAFQAAFLVLVRKAASIASRELLANWLYGVAHQTARKARAIAARRKGRERQVKEMPELAVTEADSWPDLQPVLDEELSRLPGRYRGVLVLCELEGKTRREVARKLGLPEGTVASRLVRARVLLARRLRQRGITLSGGALAAVLAQQAASAGVPPALVTSTIQAASLFAAGRAMATGAISFEVAALTQGVLKSMLLTKLKVVLALLVAVMSGAAGLIYRTQAEEPATAQSAQGKAAAAKPPASGEGETPRPDLKRLQGAWKILSTVEDGEELKDGAELVGAWTINGTTVKVQTRPRDGKTGTTTYYLRFRLEEKTNPKRIDVAEGVADDLFDTAQWEKRLDDAEWRREGIYTLAGDTLIVCVNPEKVGRPRAFESKKGSGHILTVLKRQPKGEEKPPAAVPVPPKSDKGGDVFEINARKFRIPARVVGDDAEQLKEVRLFVSVDQGGTWKQVATLPPGGDSFAVAVVKDGLYWFAVQSVRRDGRAHPSDVETMTPTLKVLVKSGQEK